jgi:hypothetical protein
MLCVLIFLYRRLGVHWPTFGFEVQMKGNYPICLTSGIQQSLANCSVIFSQNTTGMGLLCSCTSVVSIQICVKPIHRLWL